MSVAISDMQAVSFTGACLEGKTFCSDAKKKKKKLASSEERERWMAATPSLWDSCPLCTKAS